MSQPFLSDAHRTTLRAGSAISDEVIAARGYFTATTVDELRGLGFTPQQCRAPGLVIPLWTTDGEVAYNVLRPDSGRVCDDKDKPLGDGTYRQKVIKYEMPKGQAVRLDCPPLCCDALADPRVPLWITEGQKKADSLASQFIDDVRLCAVGLLGVWNWRGRNPLGGLTRLADWEQIALNGRQVIIAFDSDVVMKREVQDALRRLTAFLQNKHAHVDVLYLPKGDGGAKTGVDDYLAAGHSARDLVALLERPRPVPQAALPVVELLDGPPAELNRPLQIVELDTGGYGFAAAWLYTKVTKTESLNSRGELVRHNPPLQTTERHLFAVREDGRIFGEQPWNGVEAVEEIGLRVRLPETPQETRTWSAGGVSRFLAGERPDPVDVHRRVAETFNRFIDFDRSLTGQAAGRADVSPTAQQDMCDMAACYVMASYLLDAFTVTGYLWPTGERGSGKTQFLTLVSELGYLGTLLQMGGSFATLRDLSDYGALLCFDDAEHLSDNKLDPDKRTLLLAGNRKGCVVTIKEPAPNGTWANRYVRTFTPRCFSGITTPDAVLASRAILAPLVRTSDRGRANADVLDHRLWPHNRRRLIDDLWALGCAHVARMSAYEMQVNEESALLGRNLEPWRTILAVALWLDEQGAAGLYRRMNDLAVRYQDERRDLEREDLTTLVVEAVSKLAAQRSTDISDISDINDIKNKGGRGVMYCSASEVTRTVHELMDERESDLDKDRVVPKRIGRILGTLRFKSERGAHARKWSISQGGLQSLMLAYGITKATEGGQESDVTDVTHVIDVSLVDPLPHPIWTPQLVAACQQPFHEEREDTRTAWRDEADLRVRSKSGDEPADWDLVPVDFDTEMPAWLYAEDERSWADMAECAG